MNRFLRCLRIPLFLLVTITSKPASAQTIAQTDLKKLSLEELMDVDVTSISRTPEPLSRTAAAVSVITGEDIRRAGVTSVPEAFRLVPGIDVARFNPGSWAISSRGFNSTAANKLLVMIDGRTVYSPLFAGTFWEVQDMILDDIDRIEVVRGPGATLWGTNAVNGIINIITKSAHETKGNAVFLLGGGTDDLGIASMRSGGNIGANTSYRVYGKYYYRDEMVFADGSGAKDPVRLGHTGFRADGTHNSDGFTLQADLYRGFAGILGRPDTKDLGGDILGRWTRKFSADSDIQVQMYYERDNRRVPLQSDFRQRIFDIDFQHHWATGRHNITWGLSYRWNKDTTYPTPVLQFTPAERTYPMETAFIQDEISISRDRLKLQIGSKFEDNDFSGVEIQPSIRGSLVLRPEHFVWAAVTRAVRTPTRFDSDIRFGPPGFQFVGNPDFQAEDLVALEFGYRGRPASMIYLDIATFYNFYDQLRSLELQPSGRISILNNLNANTYGGEASLTYDFGVNFRASAGYSYLHKALTLDPGHIDVFNATIDGNDPQNQLVLRASANLKHNLEWDTTFRFVDDLPAPVVLSYAELDQRFGWTPSPNLELSLIGRNLLHNHHPEFGAAGPTREEVRRDIFGRIAIRF